jgi:hypothetical protein
MGIYKKVFSNAQNFTEMYKKGFTDPGDEIERDYDIIYCGSQQYPTKNTSLFLDYLKFLDDSYYKLKICFVTKFDDHQIHYRHLKIDIYNNVTAEKMKELYKRSKNNLIFSGRDANSRAVAHVSAQNDCYFWGVGGIWPVVGRHHFKFYQAAFIWYLQHEPNKLHLNQSVESWLSLTQEEISNIAKSQSPLATKAKAVFDERQNNHPDNYKLRAQFAQLLTDPKKIKSALDRYQSALARIEAIKCQ